MSFEAIANRYAQALFDIGVETNTLSRLVSELHDFANTYSASSELRAVLDNPLVAEADRDGLIAELARRMELGDTVRNTVRLLAQRRRLPIVPTLARALQRMSDERQGLVRAQVISAKPLDEAYAQRLQAELEKLTGKKVLLARQVDPTLIAGVVTRIGDTIIDGSIRTRLEDLRAQLLSA